MLLTFQDDVSRSSIEKILSTVPLLGSVATLFNFPFISSSIILRLEVSSKP